jgi:FtsP/CotA-like multicopper oxidase with cupredoxin domain
MTRSFTPTRRQFLRRSALAMGAAAAAPWLRGVGAALDTTHYVPRPNATQYRLRVARTMLAPDGAPQPAAAVLADGTLPGPEIRVRAGEQLRVLVDNLMADAATTIHWHGLLVPAAMDGVPDISNAPIAAQRTYVYEYPILQSGTYWYHSHYGFQEQQGLYGAFVIESTDDSGRADRDAVVLLGDWLHRDPTHVFEQLRAGAAMSGSGKTPATAKSGSTHDMTGMGAGSAMEMRKTPGGTMPPMGGADLSDVSYDAFLLNGRSSRSPWAFAARPGERIRLRVINGGASTYFRLALDGHAFTVTHADGLAVQPVEVDQLLIGMGETYDLLVALARPGSATLHAVAQDGSGQAIGVLHTPDAPPQPNTAMPVFGPRELTYAMLRAPAPTTLPAGETRTFRLPLQGNMAAYVWMIDGQAYPKADPLRIRAGERVRLELINQTGMWHPMHLHGHFFRLLQGAGDYCPLKHTANVAPGQTVVIEFTADNPGAWFFHCHNIYHLEAGMARVFEYVA